MEGIPFNRPHLVGTEFARISEAIESGKLSGNGAFAERCTAWLEERTGATRAFLTPSCTAALEMASMLTELGPGDEAITPSFAYPSTANAIALQGATPVFVDVLEDTLNADPEAIEAAVTERTRAVSIVHYGGVGCELGEIEAICERYGLTLIEDAAQGLLSEVDGRPLGGVGRLGALSFHETKNVHCGEGGALLVNDPALIEAAEVIQEKGTDRAAFFRGDVDHYSWTALGSSYVLSEIAAAFLWAQLEEADRLTERRLEIWSRYQEAFAELEERGVARRPVVPEDCRPNAHTYHLLLPDRKARDNFIAALRERGVHAVFHYVPLHSSPAGRRLGRTAGDLPVTERAGDGLARLPIWVDMTDEMVERVVEASLESLSPGARASARG